MLGREWWRLILGSRGGINAGEGEVEIDAGEQRLMLGGRGRDRCWGRRCRD
jgi:hypothetical protein